MRTEPRQCVFWVDKGDATFILNDLRIVAKHYRVRRRSFHSRGIQAAMWIIGAALTSWWNVLRAKAVVVHFGGWHALPVLFWSHVLGKRSLLFLHGVDCVAIPSIDYGNFARPGAAWATRRCYRWASVLVPVHHSLIERSDPFNDGSALRQGVRVHDPGCSTPIHPVHHGFDPVGWPLGTAPRSGFITVAVNAFDRRTYVLKGIDIFLAAAQEMPNVSFTVVGVNTHEHATVPQNVKLLPSIPQAELQHHFQGAVGYVQVSLSEGFGCALAEAMLSGCVPVVSNAGSLPDVAGGTGVVVDQRSKDALVNALREVLRIATVQKAEASRASIVSRFPEGERAEAILDLLDHSRRHS